MHGSASSIYNGMMNKIAHGTLKDVVVKEATQAGEEIEEHQEEQKNIMASKCLKRSFVMAISQKGDIET